MTELGTFCGVPIRYGDLSVIQKYIHNRILDEWEAAVIDDYMRGINMAMPDAQQQTNMQRSKAVEDMALAGRLNSLPEDDAVRGEYPMSDGCLDYFPNALAEVARVSKFGNDKHNPGQPMHWSRWNSTDHANKIIRHLIDRGRIDSNGMRHSAYVAWRALAMLQEELEQEGAPLSRASKVQHGS